MYPVDVKTQNLITEEHAAAPAKDGPAVAPRRVAAWRSRRRSGLAAPTRSRSPRGAHLTRRGASATVSSPVRSPAASAPRPASFPTAALAPPHRDRGRARAAPLRARRGRRPHAVPRALPRRRAARGPDPPPEGPAPDPDRDRHARAAARDRQPADHVARGALDRVAAHPRNDREGRRAQAPAAPSPLRPLRSRRALSLPAPRPKGDGARPDLPHLRPRAAAPAPAGRGGPRLEQERGIGPYSIGVVWTEGLGRFDRGIVGDLGLLKICSAIEGRWVEPEDTARILARYEEWAGLACVYLMAGAGRGLVPLKLSRPEVRRERIKARRAA